MSEGALDKARFEAIEAYVLGTMPHAARDRFEAEMALDGSLRTEVELQRENIRAVELAGVERTLRTMHADRQQDPAAGSTPWGTYLKYAALIAVLISGAWWWLGRSSVNEQLFAEHHYADPGLPVPMSATNDPAFHDAMVAYKLGDFAEARNKWSILLQAEPGNDTLRFYIAEAHLAEGDAPSAIPLLEGLAEDPNTVFRTKARWHLFLAYVLEDRTEDLRELGMENDPEHGEEAKAILSRILP